MAKIKKIKLFIIRVFRITLIVCGAFFLLMVIMALTPLPFWARYNLGSSKDYVPEDTKTIVVMGGGGFPSESVLMRLWFTKELALSFPESKIIVTTPGDTLDTTSTIVSMKQELIKSGIDSIRIFYEAEGLNTRHQALLIHELFKTGNFKEPLVVVSSPEHLFRTILCFEKVGFIEVSGKSAHESMLETDLRLKGKKLGGNKTVPDVGNSISLRYKFWDYMKYEITVMREYMAIAYYKIKGWI
jgi:uncharacterized SAM-binding protein YcdF (DUF218 family)